MTRSLLISIADDEAVTRATLRAMLAALGHRVVGQAENGQELLDQCEGSPAELAIIDLEMPVLDGLATAEELRATRPMPVILLSGHPDFHHVVRKQEPIEVYLSKPITLQTLDAAIREAVSRFGQPAS